jgi:UDP-3-O-[3-hydroxymyristoyl] glucosamine N-acyltransferase
MREGYVDPTAWLHPDIAWGARVRVGPGAMVGVEGFGYTWDPEAGWVHKGERYSVELHTDVSIGAGTIIARGSYRNTIVGKGTKVDAGVFIAHNVQIGQNCLIIAKAELSGSVRVGNSCWIGPGACVREHVTIGEGAVVSIGAVVVEDVEPWTTVANQVTATGKVRALPLEGRRGILDFVGNR